MFSEVRPTATSELVSAMQSQGPAEPQGIPVEVDGGSAGGEAVSEDDEIEDCRLQP